MSTREWKPGDVQSAVVNGERMLVIRGRGIFEGGWYTPGPVAGSRTDVSDSWLKDARPLVVIDPEDREQVVALRDALAKQPLVQNVPIAAMQAALRSLVEPPKPEEPQGLGAVVEDARGDHWVSRGPGYMWTWCLATQGGMGASRAWADIEVVKVLSEGVVDR